MKSALRLLWALDGRHLVAHRTRLALSVLGIASGVGLAVAVSGLTASIDASLHGIATAAASKANLEVRPNLQIGMDERVVDDLRRVPGLRAVGSTIETYAKMRHRGREERTLVLGVDAGILDLTPRAVSRRTLTSADPTGLFLPRGLAADLGAQRGSRVEVSTGLGWRRIGVGAVIPDTDVRAAVGGITVVQDLLGRTGRVDAVYIQASDPETALPAVQGAVGPRGRAGPLALRQADVRQLATTTTAALNVAAIVALFVGAFLVYNTMAMAAVERVGEAALLRALGAKRKQVFLLFLAEGALLGAIGSAFGLWLGSVLAASLLGSRGSSLESVFPVYVSRLVLRPRDLAIAAAAGVLAAVAAAYLPARRVARADPAPALGPAGALEDPTRGPERATTVLGSILFCAGFAAAIVYLRGGEENVAFAALVLSLAGTALLVRTVVPFLARVALRPAMRGPGLLRLAAGEVLRSPGRTAFTAGAVLLALALVVGFAVGLASFSRTFETSFEEILRADLYVRSATWRPLGADVPLDASLASELKRVPGVRIAYPFRIVTGSYRGQVLVILAHDFSGYASLPGLSAAYRPQAREHARLLEEPDTVLVSSSTPRRLGVRVGESIDLPTPSGTRRLRIAGTLPDPSSITSTLYLDHAEFSRLWGVAGADTFPVGVEPGADPERVKRTIMRRFGPRLGVVVDTRRQYFDRVNGIVGSIRQLIGSVQLVAVIVAGLGLANTLLISTLERRRDLGVLRAVGMLRRQVRRLVTAEALIVGGLGVLCAWVLGTAMGYFIYRIMRAQSGMPMQLVFPPLVYAAVAGLGLLGAAGAALYPAYRASRVDVVEALQYE